MDEEILHCDPPVPDFMASYPPQLALAFSQSSSLKEIEYLRVFEVFPFSKSRDTRQRCTFSYML